MVFQDLSAFIRFFIGIHTDPNHSNVLVSKFPAHITETCHLFDTVVAPGAPDVDHSDLMLFENVFTADGIAVEVCALKMDDLPDPGGTRDGRLGKLRFFKTLRQGLLQSHILLLIGRSNTCKICFLILVGIYDIKGCVSRFADLGKVIFGQQGIVTIFI